MLGDESIGETALAEADTLSPLPSVSASAEFFWTEVATAEFVWDDENALAVFGWE